jgi:OHCU decarboxylase
VTSATTPTTAFVDDVPRDIAASLLYRCCASTAWVERMLDARPFGAWQSLVDAADIAADLLTRDDWLEAFAAHPRIGDRAVLAERFACNSWEGSEQGGVNVDDDALLDRLEALNAAYEQRFGHVFLICASGLTGQQMLTGLEGRIDNDADSELAIAAGEQRKITRLRLERCAADATTGGAP